MTPRQFTFQESDFSNIFPFYIIIDQCMIVKAIGKGIQKLCPTVIDTTFCEYFELQMPLAADYDFDRLNSLVGQSVPIKCNNAELPNLKWRIDYLQYTHELLFIGTPSSELIEEVINPEINAHDFAQYATVPVQLEQEKTQEVIDDHLKELVDAVAKQKNDLRDANKAVHDIALFTTQNPDPLIRINYKGEVLQHNPAASKLDFIEFDNQLHPNDAFFKLIATKIDTSKSICEFQARSGDRDYSFVCVPMKAEKYINIYGTDITQQQKDKHNVRRLSSIIQQMVNAVIVTDATGKIEWVNNGFFKITGYTLEEVKGKSPGSFLQGQNTNASTIEYMKAKILDGEPFTCEVYNYSKSEEGYWIRINGQPVFDKLGNVVQFFAIVEDITLEKAAQTQLEEFDKRLKIALHKIGENVWEHDFATEKTSFSQQRYTLLGYTSEEFDNNVNLWYSCIYLDDKKLVIENDRRYRNGEIDYHTLEYRMVHKDGSIKWVLDRGTVIEKKEDNKPLKIIGTHKDITPQKAIEKELEQRVLQFNALAENVPGVIYEYEFRLDGTEGLKYVSPSVEKVFGLTAEQLKNVADYAHPEDLDMVIHKNEASRKGNKTFTHEARLVVPNRGTIWYSISSSYSYTTESGSNVFTGFMMDITDRKNIEQKIQEQKRFYEQILNNIPADIAVFDRNHYYLFLNPTAIKDEKLREWMIGKTDEDYVKERNKPLVIAENRRKIFNSILDSRQLQSWEEVVVEKDGSNKYILRNMYPVEGPSGEIEIVIGYGIDISYTKKIQQQIEESEKQYRDVIDNSMAIITTHDLEGKFISVNPMVGKTYGYTDKEMVGHSLVEFLPQNDKMFFETDYLCKIKEDKKFSGIFRMVHKNGHIIYTLFNNFLKEELGREPYVIAFAVDISERMKAENELKQAKKITDELAKSKQNFLANMSHEIRTPMNAIMGMATQLGKTNLAKDQALYLDTIRSATDNLLIIINDILDLSKIEAGKLSLEKIGFEPKNIIGRTMQVMHHKAEEKSLTFTNSFLDDTLWPVLIGDPYRLNQILLNLASNAIKFTEKGSVDISCTVLNDTPDKQQLQFVVKDTGIGMDEIFAQNLFQKFSQEDESVTRKYGGTGLGMSICKELVDLMEGKIYVTSTKTIGSSVFIEIEFDKGTTDDLPKKFTANIDTSILTGKKILVVDDNKMNRLVATAMLKNYDPILIQAINGIDAIQKIKDYNPDIVLMDVQMPDMDGIEATKIIRSTISKTLPIIALTALAIKGDEQKCKEAGMDDYLSKPFEESELLSITSKWLGEQIIEEMITDKKEVTQQSLFSLSKMKELAQGNSNFINVIIDTFIEQAMLSIQQLKTAFENGDTATIKKVAHRIKPSIDAMSINVLENIIREIESSTAELYANNTLQPKLHQVESVLTEVAAQLKKEKTLVL